MKRLIKIEGMYFRYDTLISKFDDCFIYLFEKKNHNQCWESLLSKFLHVSPSEDFTNCWLLCNMDCEIKKEYPIFLSESSVSCRLIIIQEIFKKYCWEYLL